MTVIDPTTPIGKIRLRIGDWSDLPILPDAVISSAIDDSEQNLPRAASLCAQYILATLTFKSHKKLAQIETWSGEQFDNYLHFLKAIVLNPNFSSVYVPIPYNGDQSKAHPLLAFVNDWNTEFNANNISTTGTGYVDLNKWS